MTALGAASLLLWLIGLLLWLFGLLLWLFGLLLWLFGLHDGTALFGSSIAHSFERSEIVCCSENVLLLPTLLFLFHFQYAVVTAVSSSDDWVVIHWYILPFRYSSIYSSIHRLAMVLGAANTSNLHSFRLALGLGSQHFSFLLDGLALDLGSQQLNIFTEIDWPWCLAQPTTLSFTLNWAGLLTWPANNSSHLFSNIEFQWLAMILGQPTDSSFQFK